MPQLPLDENDKRTQNWQVQLNNAKSALNGMERELKENNKALENTESEMTSASKDTNKFNKKLSQVSSTAADTKSKLSKMGSALKKISVGIGASIAVIGTSAVASGKKMWSLSNDVAEYGDKVDKTSQKIGISSASYQKWGYVFERCGANVDGLQVGMKKLSGVITDASNGSDSAKKKISALGLSIDDLNGKSQDEQLSLVISSLQNMKSGAERTAVANSLLGKSAVDMAGVLNMSAKETNALKKEAQDYGMVMDDKAVKASANFEDSLTKVKGTVTGLKNNMVGSLLPAITEIMDGFSDLVAGNKNASEKMKSGVSNVIKSVTDMLSKVVELVSTVAQAVLKMLPQLLLPSLKVY